jgi:hypothetical protein
VRPDVQLVFVRRVPRQRWNIRVVQLVAELVHHQLRVLSAGCLANYVLRTLPLGRPDVFSEPRHHAARGCVAAGAHARAGNGNARAHATRRSAAGARYLALSEPDGPRWLMLLDGSLPCEFRNNAEGAHRWLCAPG